MQGLVGFDGRGEVGMLDITLDDTVNCRMGDTAIVFTQRPENVKRLGKAIVFLY